MECIIVWTSGDCARAIPGIAKPPKLVPPIGLGVVVCFPPFRAYFLPAVALFRKSPPVVSSCPSGWRRLAGGMGYPWYDVLLYL